MDATADLLAVVGQAEAAVQLWHAAQAVRTSRLVPESQDPPTDRAALKETARATLDDVAFQSSAAAGLALDRDAAVEAALVALAG